MYARQVDAPHSDPVNNGPRNVAQDRRRTQRMLHGASTHHMLTDLIEGGPEIRVCVVTTSEAHQDPRAHSADEVLVFATRVKGFCSREEAANLSEESNLVHALTMCIEPSISSPARRPVENLRGTGACGLFPFTKSGMIHGSSRYPGESEVLMANWP